MKSFGQKPWVVPQPVLIIGTYNNDGTPNAMNAAWGGQWDSTVRMASPVWRRCSSSPLSLSITVISLWESVWAVRLRMGRC